MTTVGALLGAALAALGGYLLGARLGADARRRVAATVARAEAELKRVRLELSGVLRVHAQRSADLEPEAETDPRVEALVQRLEGLVGPMARRAQVQGDLTSLPEVFRHRGHLEDLLDAVAARAGLSAVVLSDEVGLPLAAAVDEACADPLAATASLLLTLADRYAEAGQPAAISVVVQDAEQRRIVHRIFRAGAERYVLTGVSPAEPLAPDTLDPALPHLQRLLAGAGPALEAVA